MADSREVAPLTAVAPTVLVVDDEKNIRRTLEMVLGGEGYRVLEAESAEQALELIRNPRQPVDVAILDLKLPGMSGLEALEKLRADEATRELPVIVVSGHATVHDAVSAIKLGASDFFEKPLNRERVLVSVRNSVRAARRISPRESRVRVLVVFAICCRAGASGFGRSAGLCTSSTRRTRCPSAPGVSCSHY